MSKGFSVEQLQGLMRCVAENEIGEFLLEEEGMKLRIRGMKPEFSVDGPTATFTTHQTAPSMRTILDDTSAQETVPKPVDEIVISSPLVGTFYASAGPEKEPFVKVGQQINEGETVFIIESMKVMNEVPADKSGVVAEILVENGGAVEYGQPILRLE